jgi:hypothetical protein
MVCGNRRRCADRCRGIPIAVAVGMVAIAITVATYVFDLLFAAGNRSVHFSLEPSPELRRPGYGGCSILSLRKR